MLPFRVCLAICRVETKSMRFLYTDTIKPWPYDKLEDGINGKNRYAQGVQKLSEIYGTGAQGVIDSLQNIAPEVIEFAFGDIYCRDGLNL